MSSEPMDEERLQEIIGALENKKFKWRTVSGIAKELGFPESEIVIGLNKLLEKGIAMRSTVPAASGEEIFTTPEHYKSFASPVQRLAAAFRNRSN